MAKQALGSMEYKPTRLEWLAVIVNSMLANVASKNIFVYCFAGDDEKTIKLHIQYNPFVKKEHISKIEADIKQIILDAASKYDWDSWVNIETVFSVK